ETSHQPTSRGLPRPIRGLLVNQAPAHKQSDTLHVLDLAHMIDLPAFGLGLIIAGAVVLFVADYL
ncbi:hypothetical protein ACQZEV_05415, partial [Corynebacterium diphtheriae]